MPDDVAASAPAPPRQKRAGARRVKADIVVDLGLCKACGICISLCPTHVFDADDAGQAVAVRPEDCTVCRLCEWHCPDFAIEVLAREAGDDEAVKGAPAATAAGKDA